MQNSKNSEKFSKSPRTHRADPTYHEKNIPLSNIRCKEVQRPQKRSLPSSSNVRWASSSPISNTGDILNRVKNRNNEDLAKGPKRPAKRTGLRKKISKQLARMRR